jgi:hypothetical protein
MSAPNHQLQIILPGREDFKKAVKVSPTGGDLEGAWLLKNHYTNHSLFFIFLRMIAGKHNFSHASHSL